MADSQNVMKEEKTLSLKLEKYVVLPGKMSGYHTEGFLGEGSYGKVVKCTKLDTKEIVAVKIVRKHYFREGKKEARMLKKILQLDPERNNLLRFIESFTYKGHFCLAFEMLDVSMFDFMKARDFAPLHVSEIRVVAQQLLVALNALKSAGLVHADMKPDNIMLVNHKSQPFKVKLIDFGLAIKVSKLWLVGTIQAIGYRAPEVILGLPRDESVDMWSLGCSLAYMYLGYNLYPTHCEYEVIRAIVKIHGQPQDDVLKEAMDVQHFFTKLGESSYRMFRLNTPAEYTNATGFATQHKAGIYNNLHCLDDLLKTRPRPTVPTECEDALGFMSLLKQMLLMDPNVRITPREGLCHHFITMKHLTGGGNNPYVVSAWKRVADAQLQEFATEHYATLSNVFRREMVHSKKNGQIEDAAGRVADKEQVRRTLIKEGFCFTVSQEDAIQPDTAADGSNDKPSDKEWIGRTFIKLRSRFVHQESAETADKPGKSEYIPLEKTGCNTCQQKGSESNTTGKALKDKQRKEKTIIKVKPYSAVEDERKDRAYKVDVLSGKAKVPGPSKKSCAAEKEAIFCKEGRPSDLVEVKTRKTPMRRAWNSFSRLIASISCIRGCE
ncbi:hypothetical protein ATANTOWER_026649 [Ataeniobius toweri]|uniref:Protein kinase domain-containing protein n=1 Tax=Ataeniobius toweri TaxID=208326 RepID=A0ABU7CIM1_9TELE|nr:hypothetical protein [Ataeniobius toweri]